MIDPEEILSLPLNIEERGLHVTLIAMQLRESELPGNLQELAERVRMAPERFERLWERVGLAFELRNGSYVHPATAERMAKRREISEKRSRAAHARHARANAGGDVQVQPFAVHGHANEKRPSPSAGSPPTPPSPSLSLPEETTPPVIPPQRSKSRADAKATRVPEPFVLTPAMRSWAASNVPGLDVDAATEEFVDYWRGIPGARGRNLDWIATWRNGMKRQHRMMRPPPRGAPPRPQQRSLTELEQPTRGRYDDYTPPDD